MPRSNPERLSRRGFLGRSGAMAALGALPSRGAAAEKAELEPGSVVLFQGDSITDAGRDKKRHALMAKTWREVVGL